MKKIKDLTKKQKYTFGGIFIAVVGILIASVLVLNKPSKQEITLKKQEVIVEYGEMYSTNPLDYVKTTNKDIEKDIILTINNKIVSNKGKSDKMFIQLKVGTYDGKVEYKKEVVEFKVKVKDTIEPEFVDFKEKVEVVKDYKDDLTKTFKAEDLSKVTMTVDTKDVDFSKQGEYKAKVTAKDEYKNKTTKDFTVVVGDKTEAQVEEEKKVEEAKKVEQEQQAQQEANNQQGTTSQGGSTTNGSNPSGNTSTGGGTNTGGGSVQPPTEPIVQFTPTPLGSQLFDTEEQALAWAWTIWETGQSNRNFAAQYGYTMISNWYNDVVKFGYASTGKVVYVKHVIVWTFK